MTGADGTGAVGLPETLDALAAALARLAENALAEALLGPLPPAAVRDTIADIRARGEALLAREEVRPVGWIGALRLADAAAILLDPCATPEQREVAARLHAYGIAAVTHADVHPATFARAHADLATAVLAAHDHARRSTSPPASGV